MFFRILRVIPLLLISVLPLPSSANQVSPGRACFDDALARAQRGEDLQKILLEHVSVADIASQAAWEKWRIRWSDLATEKKQAAIKEVHAALDNFSGQFFHNIILDSLVVRDETLEDGSKVWGSYKIKADSSSDRDDDFTMDTFELRIFSDGCLVIRIQWNNVSLYRHIAKKL